MFLLALNVLQHVRMRWQDIIAFDVSGNEPSLMLHHVQETKRHGLEQADEAHIGILRRENTFE